MAKIDSRLQEISPDSIRRNPDNPRLIFREGEMNELLESIKEVGIKVPLIVYQDDQKYRLIDGERRWLCAKRLNLATVPVHIQPQPSHLENLLMMFNIHNVRIAWDLMPMALKLGEIRELLLKEGQETTPKVLATLTGVRLSTIRRALDLLELPKKYQNMLLREARRPREVQQVTADLFMEIYKARHAVERHTPEVFNKVSKSEFVDSMLQKYLDKVVDNMVAYREVSKIARAQLAGEDRRDAATAIIRLIKDSAYSVAQAFEDTVQAAYERRDLLTRLRGIIARLAKYSAGRRLDDETRQELERLRSEIDRILGQ